METVQIQISDHRLEHLRQETQEVPQPILTKKLWNMRQVEFLMLFFFMFLMY